MIGRLLGWLRSQHNLTQVQQHKLSDWRDIPSVTRPRAINSSRCVVVDVETSGLNLWEDRLISIGAVAVVNGKIDLGDCFYSVLQQETASDRENILLHGIGVSEQTEGVPAADALLAFLHFLQKDPLIAFHVTFDKTMIVRAMRKYLGYSFNHLWSDMAYVMPALNPELASRYRSLDEWLGHFDIRNDARHNALADALVTAQLFQVGAVQAKKRNIIDFVALRDLEKAQRWVSEVG